MSVEKFAAIIAVYAGATSGKFGAFILDVISETPCVLHYDIENIGRHTDDFNFSELPTEPGVYMCVIDAVCVEGYVDGYRALGEDDWRYEIISSTQIMQLSKRWPEQATAIK